MAAKDLPSNPMLIARPMIVSWFALRKLPSLGEATLGIDSER